jgi:hypothetical protein
MYRNTNTVLFHGQECVHGVENKEALGIHREVLQGRVCLAILPCEWGWIFAMHLRGIAHHCQKQKWVSKCRAVDSFLVLTEQCRTLLPAPFSRSPGFLTHRGTPVCLGEVSVPQMPGKASWLRCTGRSMHISPGLLWSLPDHWSWPSLCWKADFCRADN